MGGRRTTRGKLNRTLEKVCDILNKNNVHDWFIFFGTLLGIVRNNSCINGDDDLDIMINHDYQELRSIFEKEGFEFQTKYQEREKVWIEFPDTMLKTKPNNMYASVDFYMCDVNKCGDFYSPWEKTYIRNVYDDISKKTFIKKDWNNVSLNLPLNFEKKLAHMYGNWKVPRKKGKSKQGNDIP